jgi:hypothetical protein
MDGNRGYLIAICDDSDFYIPDAEHIERNDRLHLFETDDAASRAAEQDGIKLIHGMPGVPDCVYIDSEKNRAVITSMLEKYPEYKQWEGYTPEQPANVHEQEKDISMDMGWSSF